MLKHYPGSLTTVVRAQNDTSKTANITDIIFDRTYSYSPYKRRRFENRWYQTFCILLIKDVLSVIERANLRQRQNLKRKWSGIRSRIILLIWIRMSVISVSPSQNCGCIISSASVISPSMVQIGCWLYENREILTNVRKSLIPQWWRKWKTGIHAQIRITTKSQPLLEGHLLPVPAKFGRRPFPGSSFRYPVYRMTENDHITSALLAEVIIIIINNEKLEINMHHLHGTMQYRQAPWAILAKFCVVDGFLSFPFSDRSLSKILTLSV